MPSIAGYRLILGDGLWRNNTGFVQLLGLCPLLAISTTVVNALGLGLATMLVFLASNVTVSLIRRWAKRKCASRFSSW